MAPIRCSIWSTSSVYFLNSSVNTSQRGLSCAVLFCDWVECFLVDDIFYKTPSSWVKWIIQHQFLTVSALHRKNLEHKLSAYSKAETNKQKLKIKRIVFGATSSASKQSDCYFFLMIRFVGLTVCLVLNFLYKYTLIVIVLINHYYPKHLTAVISILIFLKQSCKRVMLKFLSSFCEAKY